MNYPAMLHLTDKAFYTNERLTPQKDSYVCNPENHTIESALAKYKPDNLLCRSKSVFALPVAIQDYLSWPESLKGRGEKGSAYAIELNYTYAECSDLQWWSGLSHYLTIQDQFPASKRDIGIKYFAEGYWSGKLFGDNIPPRWEARLPFATCAVCHKL